LLIPAGSKLLELPETQAFVGNFDESALCYPWRHPDARMDRLYADVMAAVKLGQAHGDSRRAIFEQVWRLAHEPDSAAQPIALARTPQAFVPRLSEPWYCCAEPTEEQIAPELV
jgi:hypothetical protein